MARLASRVVKALWFRATLALLAVYAVALPLGLLAGSMARQALQVQGWAHQTEHVVGDVQDLELAMDNQDAGLRGYVLTAGQSFLTEYATGRTEVRSAWSALAADAAGSSLESGLPQLKATMDAWQGWATQRSLAPPASGTVVRDILTEGTELFAEFRSDADRFGSLADALARHYRADSDRLQQRGLIAGTITPIAGPGALLLLGSMLLWLALRPVNRLAAAARRLAAGREGDIPYTKRRDEIGSVARALAGWQNAERSQDAMVRLTPIGMLTVTLDLEVRDPNPALSDMFGYSHHEMAAGGAAFISRVTHPDDRAPTRRLYKRLAAGESELERIEKRYFRPDNSMFWGAYTMAIVRDVEGQPAFYVGMIEDITERKEKLARAAKAQRDLLPDAVPDLPGYELAGLCRPTEEVGGDFYDWYQPDPGTLVLTLADVMGKGMPAAILMATVRIALRSSDWLPTVGEVVDLVAESTVRDLDKAESFTTLFHARLDLATGRVTYVDGGHGLLVVVGPDGAVRPPRSDSLPLGVMAGQCYTELSLSLRPGDALLVFSDGVLDVHPDLEQDLEGTAAALLAGAETAQEMAERLATNPESRVMDDVTVVALRRLA